MKKKNIIFVGILGIVFLLILVILGFIYLEIKNGNQKPPYQGVSEDGTFSTSFIRASHKKAKGNNYMVSPYSVEIALSMLREGAAGTSLEEIEEVVPERSIKTLAVSKKVNVANAIFIRDTYKQNVKEDFMTALKENYGAEVIYDPFKEPTKINNWVNKETNGMIPKILNDVSEDFVLGLANAVAMEEEWLLPFECESTRKEKFKTLKGDSMNVPMMRKTFDAQVGYYKDEEGNAEIVTIPYKIYDRLSGKEAEEEGEQLEFIGILPDDLDSYIAGLDLEKIKTIESNKTRASNSFEVRLGLPRYEFSYDFQKFKKTLNDMGIQSVFSDSADLSRMLTGMDAYVSEAIHKTYVKVDENGTKAAAITFFGVEKNAAIGEEKEFVEVTFDKPFIFMIKDTTSNEILFFGVVYEPEKWDASKTC